MCGLALRLRCLLGLLFRMGVACGVACGCVSLLASAGVRVATVRSGAVSCIERVLMPGIFVSTPDCRP